MAAPLRTRRHEYAHQRAGCALGMRTGDLVCNADGTGSCVVDTTGHPVLHRVAVAYAGGYGEGTHAYARTDKSIAEADLQELPRRERARTRREGKALARQLVRRHRGAINAAARRHR